MTLVNTPGDVHHKRTQIQLIAQNVKADMSERYRQRVREDKEYAGN
jgi:hypothetical protein